MTDPVSGPTVPVNNPSLANAKSPPVAKQPKAISQGYPEKPIDWDGDIKELKSAAADLGREKYTFEDRERFEAARRKLKEDFARAFAAGLPKTVDGNYLKFAYEIIDRIALNRDPIIIQESESYDF